jgi:hypothetical protein
MDHRRERGAGGFDLAAQPVGVVGLVGEHNGVLAQVPEQTRGDRAIARLAGRQNQFERQTVGVDERVDLGRQRTAQVSAMRAHLAEYGVVAAKGISRLRDLLPVLDASAGILPELARQTLLLIAQLIEALTLQIRKIETELLAWHRSNSASQRLETIPGVGSSPPPRWPPSCSTRGHSDQAASSPPGSGWCRARTPAGNGWAASPRWAIAIYAICSSAPPPSSATPGARQPPSASGQTGCWIANPPGWSPSRSPTRWPGSPGPSWRGKRIIAPPPRRRVRSAATR